jgi:hypothetical protein
MFGCYKYRKNTIGIVIHVYVYKEPREHKQIL